MKEQISLALQELSSHWLIDDDNIMRQKRFEGKKSWEGIWEHQLLFWKQ